MALNVKIPMQDDANSASSSNPMGTDGFEFVEYASPDPKGLAAIFEGMGFVPIAKHRSKDVTLWRQGDINFILNAEHGGQAEGFYNTHGPSANAMAFRVKDAAVAIKRAQELGIETCEGKVGPMELSIPAIRGIGGSLIYLVDRYGDQTIYDIDFRYLPGADRHPKGAGLTYIDHLTHNVHRGNMDVWAGYYQRVFNFRQIRYFDIEGKLTGLYSKAMTSPCGKIRIPINESADDKSQIEEFLREYKGEGIQHIALGTSDIYASVEALKARKVRFMDAPPATYYDNLATRLKGHGEDTQRMKKLGILLDGAPESKPGAADGGLLLQIFTATVIGPIFYEVIQRKGDEGFGEGNFKALFESIEQDQIKKGTLKA
jgi:4-hydroxyphenylpyruvate dioxygenase